jgi:hypothetical protein
MIKWDIHTPVFQLTDWIHGNDRIRSLGLNANAAWSSRRVNGRTSEESLNVGYLCHPRYLHCPAVVICSSRVLYVFHGKIDNAGSVGGLLAKTLDQVV